MRKTTFCDKDIEIYGLQVVMLIRIGVYICDTTYLFFGFLIYLICYFFFLKYVTSTCNDKEYYLSGFQ